MPNDIPSSCGRDRHSGPKENIGLRESLISDLRTSQQNLIEQPAMTAEANARQNYRQVAKLFIEICKNGDRDISVDTFDLDTLKDSIGNSYIDALYRNEKGPAASVRLNPPKYHLACRDPEMAKPELLFRYGDEMAFLEVENKLRAGGIDVRIASSSPFSEAYQIARHITMPLKSIHQQR